MKKKFKFLVSSFLSTAVLSSIAMAEVTAHPSSMGKLQVVTMKNNGTNFKVIVNTNSSDQPLKRSVNFGRDGLVSITGNNSTINSSSGTAQQVYTIIPFSSETPKVLAQNENETVIQDGSGLRWRFSTKTGELINVEGCETQTGKLNKVTVDNPANLKLLSCKGKLIVDYGTRSGNEVRLNMNKSAKITDANGKSCSVPFSMLHRVVPKDEIQNNFKNHEQFLGIVKNLCAGINLKVDPVVLASPAANGASGKDEDAFEAQIRRLQDEATREAQPAAPARKAGGAR